MSGKKRARLSLREKLRQQIQEKINKVKYRHEAIEYSKTIEEFIAQLKEMEINESNTTSLADIQKMMEKLNQAISSENYEAAVKIGDTVINTCKRVEEEMKEKTQNELRWRRPKQIRAEVERKIAGVRGSKEDTIQKWFPNDYKRICADLKNAQMLYDSHAVDAQEVVALFEGLSQKISELSNSILPLEEKSIKRNVLVDKVTEALTCGRLRFDVQIEEPQDPYAPVILEAVRGNERIVFDFELECIDDTYELEAENVGRNTESGSCKDSFDAIAEEIKKYEIDAGFEGGTYVIDTTGPARYNYRQNQASNN